MRKIRTVVAIACTSAALLAGVGAPAQAASPTSKPATVSAGFEFGVYYTLDACRYFGNSLVQGGAFSSYSCSPMGGYWHLYVW